MHATCTVPVERVSVDLFRDRDTFQGNPVRLPSPSYLSFYRIFRLAMSNPLFNGFNHSLWASQLLWVSLR